MKVAVLGFGVVGVGVYDMLASAEGLEQGSVLVRPGKDDAPFKVTSIDEIVNDPEIWAVAEVMGGIEPAFSYTSAALKAGKHVVTSNKALVAAHGIELDRLARQNNAAFLFSAACGGGVPFLHNLSIAVQSDSVKKLGGILNGTTNYMLDAMQRRCLGYEEALADAQRLGYAEADPGADVSGLDALRKIMLACAVTYDKLPVNGLLWEGIESFTAADVEDIKAKGLVCRLLACGGLDPDGKMYAYVEPKLVVQGAVESSVINNFNMACYTGDNSGDIVLIGQGAGRRPTASAVLRDLSCILQGQYHMLGEYCESAQAENGGCEHSYYVRLPEVFKDVLPAKVTEILDGTAIVITKPMSVSLMHETAARLRAEGAKIFFAGMGD